MVGRSGKVIAADLQQGMLEILGKKLQGSGLEERVQLHKCGKDRLGVKERVDFVLAFYMVHEVPDQSKFLEEVRSILRPGGKMFLVEPKFHVSKKGFELTLKNARNAGFRPIGTKRVLFSRAVLLERP